MTPMTSTGTSLSTILRPMMLGLRRTALARRVAEDREWRTVRQILFGREHPAQQRPRAEDLKRVGADETDGETHRFPCIRQVLKSARPEPDAGHRGCQVR